MTHGQVGSLYFIGPVTEVQGGSVYPHDPGENLGLCKGGGGGPKKILMATVCRHTPHGVNLISVTFQVSQKLWVPPSMSYGVSANYFLGAGLGLNALEI